MVKDGEINIFRWAGTALDSENESECDSKSETELESESKSDTKVESKSKVENESGSKRELSTKLLDPKVFHYLIVYVSTLMQKWTS